MGLPDEQPPAVTGTWSEESLAAVWREHRRWVAAVLLAHAPRPGTGAGSGTGADLDDLLQEVAMALVRNIHKLKPEAVAPWLRTVAVNAARTAGRRATTAKKALGTRESIDRTSDSSSLRTAPRDGNSRSDSRDRGREALAIIHDLPADYREPLLLSLRGLSHKQISLVLTLPVSTIETRLFRARAMVREELEARARRPERGPFPLNSVAGRVDHA